MLCMMVGSDLWVGNSAGLSRGEFAERVSDANGGAHIVISDRKGVLIVRNVRIELPDVDSM